MLKSRFSHSLGHKFSILKVFLVVLMFLGTTEVKAVVLTMETDPPEGGTASGAGTYVVDTHAQSHIVAAPGWYIEDIVFSGPSNPVIGGRVELTPQELWAHDIALRGLFDPAFDPTTVTEYDSRIYMHGDCIVRVVFAPLSPHFENLLYASAFLSGDTLTLSPFIHGRLPISYQWQKDGSNLPGKTADSLSIPNATPQDSGKYTLLAWNSFGTNNFVLDVTVGDILALADYTRVGGKGVHALGQTEIQFISIYDGLIFYTLDGSEPTVDSTLYTGPFLVTKNSELRAVTFKSDFSASGYLRPVSIVLDPAFRITVSAAGGSVSFDPPLQVFAPNSTVTLTANPSQSWSFLNWGGDVSGRGASVTVTMTKDMSVEAVFGTLFRAVSSGNGTVSVAPASFLYPYGSTPILTATPAPGYYFSGWSGVSVPSWFKANPLRTTVESAAIIATANFAPIPETQFFVKVEIDGDGYVPMFFPNGLVDKNTLAALVANPNPGREFLGWTGDTNSTELQLSLVVDGNKSLVAHFSRASNLELLKTGTDLSLRYHGLVGDVAVVESTADFTAWEPFLTVTNFVNDVNVSVLTPTNAARIFRAVLK